MTFVIYILILHVFIYLFNADLPFYFQTNTKEITFEFNPVVWS
jgi:hypothetical protein